MTSRYRQHGNADVGLELIGTDGQARQISEHFEDLANGATPWIGDAVGGASFKRHGGATGEVTRSNGEYLGAFVDIRDFGAKVDVVLLPKAGALTSSSTALTVTGASFTSADVGKCIGVHGAGATGGILATTIAAVTGLTTVTLTDAASTTVTAADVGYFTDDVPAVQAAIDFLKLRPQGGTALISGGMAGFGTCYTEAGGLVFSIVISGDSISLAGLDHGSGIYSPINNTSQYRPIMVFGGAKNYDIGDWADNILLGRTPILINSAAKGDTSVTTATAGDAAAFTAGKIVGIKTGNCLSTSATGNPDSELNEVRVSGVAGTGVIALAKPIAKSYVQESYLSGSTGVTSPTGGGTSAPFGIVDMSDAVIRNAGIRNLTIDCRGCLQVVSLWGVYGGFVENITGQYGRLFCGGRDAFAIGVFDNNTEAVAAQVDDYYTAPSNGCGHWNIYDNLVRSNNNAYAHNHEGTYQISWRNNKFYLTNFAGKRAVSIAGRAYDFSYIGNTVFGVADSSAYVVYIDPDCLGGNGNISKNNFIVTGSPTIRNDAGGSWFVDDNVAPGLFTSLRGMQNGVGHDVGQRVLQCCLTKDKTSITMGVIPRYAFVDFVTIFKAEAFNSDGTDLLSVGYSGTTGAFVSALDVSATGRLFLKTGDSGAGTQLSGNQQSQAQTVLATYTAGGSAPTTGKVIVRIFYSVGARYD